MLKYLNYEEVSGDQDKAGDERQVDEKDEEDGTSGMRPRWPHQEPRGSRSARRSHKYAKGTQMAIQCSQL
jgi:hypothetical protein